MTAVDWLWWFFSLGKSSLNKKKVNEFIIIQIHAGFQEAEFKQSKYLVRILM